LQHDEGRPPFRSQHGGPPMVQVGPPTRKDLRSPSKSLPSMRTPVPDQTRGWPPQLMPSTFTSTSSPRTVTAEWRGRFRAGVRPNVLVELHRRPHTRCPKPSTEDRYLLAPARRPGAAVPALLSRAGGGAQWAGSSGVRRGLGLRLGEAFGLSPERGTVQVRRQVKLVGYRRIFGPPKYGKEREVPSGSENRRIRCRNRGRTPMDGGAGASRRLRGGACTSPRFR
jgi:hypothetical protein